MKVASFSPGAGKLARGVSREGTGCISFQPRKWGWTALPEASYGSTLVSRATGLTPPPYPVPAGCPARARPRRRAPDLRLWPGGPTNGRIMEGMADRVIMTRLTRGRAPGREFDIAFWQALGPTRIFEAAWDLVVAAAAAKGIHEDQLRLQRSVTKLIRRGRRRTGDPRVDARTPPPKK